MLLIFYNVCFVLYFCLSPNVNVRFGFKGVVTSGSLVALLALRMGKT